MKDRAVIDSGIDLYSKWSLNSKTATSLTILLYIIWGTDGEKRRSDADDRGRLVGESVCEKTVARVIYLSFEVIGEASFRRNWQRDFFEDF